MSTATIADYLDAAPRDSGVGDDLPTAIYQRQSLNRDRRKVSIPYQREGNLKLCAARGYRNVFDYTDDNISAKPGSKRPDWERLIRDIADGTIKRVVVWDDDRLRRTVRDGEDFIDLADRYGVLLANSTGDVNLSEPEGRWFFRQKGSMAQYEIEQKARRQKAANAFRAKNGKAWVSRPFGYTMKVDLEAAVDRARSKAYFDAIDAGKSEKDAVAAGEAAAQARAAKYNPVTDSADNQIVRHEAAAIRKACRDLLHGASLWSIAQEWNSSGLTTSTGATWTGHQLRQVLMRARNAGLQVYNVKEAQAEARRLGKPVYKAGIVEGATVAWKPILKPETWESVCKLLEDPKRHTGKSPGRKYLLSGIAICGECHRPIGSGVQGTKPDPKRPVYSCKRPKCMKIVRDLAQVDEVVIGAITERLSEPDAAAKLCKPTVDTESLHEQIGELDAQIKEAEHDYDEGLIDAKRMNARVERVNQKLEPLRNQLFGSYMSADVKKLAGNPDAAELFDDLPLDRQRGIIEQLASVTIRRQERKGGRFEPEAIHIEWK